MATRVSYRMRTAALLLLSMLAVSACASSARLTVQPDAVALPTPLQSMGMSLAATVDALGQAVAAAGARLAPAEQPYHPSEPESLLQVPRVVLRADLADAEDGFVVVYQLPDAAAAELQGRSMADHLASGFGQTNFSPDAQFSVRHLGDTLDLHHLVTPTRIRSGPG